MYTVKNSSQLSCLLSQLMYSHKMNSGKIKYIPTCSVNGHVERRNLHYIRLPCMVKWRVGQGGRKRCVCNVSTLQISSVKILVNS